MVFFSPSLYSIPTRLISWTLLDSLDVERGEVDLDHEEVVVHLRLPRAVPEPVLHHRLIEVLLGRPDGLRALRDVLRLLALHAAVAFQLPLKLRYKIV